MAPKVERGLPIYLQIANAIRDEIRAGKLAEGDRIPSVRRISATWDIAQATALRVQAVLRSEGLVRSVPGVGTVVSTRETAAGGADLLSATRSRGRVYTPDSRAVVTSSELVKASAAIADALGVRRGHPVVRRERVTDRAGSPSSVSVSWLPGDQVDRAPRLLSTERVPEGTFAYLAHQLGLELTGGREQTCASAATEAQAAVLHVPEGSPVQLIRTWFFAGPDTVIEYGEAAHPSDRWLSHELDLD